MKRALGIDAGLLMPILASISISCSNDPTGSEPEIPEVLRSVVTFEEGQFLYDSGECRFVPPDESTPHTFECGKIVIGLKSGVGASEMADLLTELSGDVVKDRSGGDFGWLVVAVPMRSEREAILRAFQDERVRYASLNFTGPAVLPGS